MHLRVVIGADRRRAGLARPVLLPGVTQPRRTTARTSALATAAAAAFLFPGLARADGSGCPSPGIAGLRDRLLQKFDTDGDGKIGDGEREGIRGWFKDHRDDIREKLRERFADRHEASHEHQKFHHGAAHEHAKEHHDAWHERAEEKGRTDDPRWKAFHDARHEHAEEHHDEAHEHADFHHELSHRLHGLPPGIKDRLKERLDKDGDGKLGEAEKERFRSALREKLKGRACGKRGTGGKGGPGNGAYGRFGRGRGEGPRGGKFGSGGPGFKHPPKGNNGVGNGEDPQPPGNPRVNDGPGTRPGSPGNRGGRGPGSGFHGRGRGR